MLPSLFGTLPKAPPSARAPVGQQPMLGTLARVEERRVSTMFLSEPDPRVQELENELGTFMRIANEREARWNQNVAQLRTATQQQNEQRDELVYRARNMWHTEAESLQAAMSQAESQAHRVRNSAAEITAQYRNERDTAEHNNEILRNNVETSASEIGQLKSELRAANTASQAEQRSKSSEYESSTLEVM